MSVRAVLARPGRRALLATLAAATVVAVAGLVAPGAAHAQAWPAKPVRIVVPFTSGSSDLVARLIQPKLAEAWKQPVIVENRPGGNTIIGTDFVAKAAPDGYTLLMALGTHVISPSLMKTPYDPVNDFTALATVCAAELAMVINNDLPATNLQEFIALAKSRPPGALNYSATQLGGNQHVAGELFAILTGAKMTVVPYKGAGEAVSAVMAGHVQAYIGSIASLAPVIRSGKARGIAVSGDGRHPTAPNLPTFTEQGVKNFDVRLWYAMLGPAGMPADLTARISADVNAILATADFKEALAKQGLDPLVSTPAQFTTLLKNDFARYADVIRRANIRVEQ
jgi:tripartite-type tricarboxylate transporter receptor subunit TctC